MRMRTARRRSGRPGRRREAAGGAPSTAGQGCSCQFPSTGSVWRSSPPPVHHCLPGHSPSRLSLRTAQQCRAQPRPARYAVRREPDSPQDARSASPLLVVSRLPTATRGSNNSYTTSWDTTVPWNCAKALLPMARVNRPLGRRDPIVHRVTAVWFPRFAIECWQRRVDRRGKAPPGDLPVALARDGPHGPVVHAANGAAEQAGVREGGHVADMRTLCPELFVEQADIGGDSKALERLMLWTRPCAAHRQNRSFDCRP